MDDDHHGRGGVRERAVTIRTLRILPPLAIGRVGSAEEPMDNYTLADPDPSEPLGYRTIQAAPTFRVNRDDGSIESAETPPTIVFKEGGKIRPVAPFLEVFADTGNELRALTAADVERVSWSVEVKNRKVVRRTGDDLDVVSASVVFDDHESHELQGRCEHFVADKFVSFGHVRYIRPNHDFPQIRLRFTPAKGLIYGPVGGGRHGFKIDEERQVYDPSTGGIWVGFDAAKMEKLKGFYNETVPPSLFAINPPAPSWLFDNKAISRGYLDDVCDGFVSVTVVLKGGRALPPAKARIVAAPPALAPDSMFVRTLADDLDQVVNGPTVRLGDEPASVTQARALDIVRRAYETVRFMNVVVMNGNDYRGRPALSLDSMPQEEAADTERAIRPVMAPATVDTFAIMTLHQQAYAAIQSGAAPWFVRLLRQPDEAADFTDRGRRKMPALMCGADNNYLALTWRQIDTIEKSALASGQKSKAEATRLSSSLTPRNLAAQINYQAGGNPISSQPRAAVANCCPGLEVDFRAVWRRMFKGLLLREYDNLVVEVESTDPRLQALKGHRLLRVHLPKDHRRSELPKRYADGIPMMTPIKGPASSDLEGYIVQTTDQNPYGLAPLEWSNALAHVLPLHGKQVRCDFSREKSLESQRPWAPDAIVWADLEVQSFFEDGAAVISSALAEAGELTQGLCSPWQNDYRECSCYYWASARPDYVNVELGEDGLSKGDNWMQKRRTGSYVADDYADKRLVDYDEMFAAWETLLKFQIGGRDAEEAVAVTPADRQE